MLRQDIPILYLFFNRSSKVQTSFKAIADIKPKKLFLAADGPRLDNPWDQFQCMKCKEILEKMITWDCECKFLYREKNLGCGKAVSEAITWFFAHVDEGIIIEDDVVLDPAFYDFAGELLEKYRYDVKVAQISAVSFLSEGKSFNYSYHFSNYTHVWGWATWKRAWDKFDYNAVNSSNFLKENYLTEFLKSSAQSEYWIRAFAATAEGKIDTWDYRWHASVFLNGMLSITPARNLSKNIGFDQFATHTKGKKFSLKLNQLELPIKHPQSVLPNYSQDKKLFKRIYASKTSVKNHLRNSLSSFLPQKVYSTLKRLWNSSLQENVTHLRRKLTSNSRLDETRPHDYLVKDGYGAGLTLNLRKDAFAGWEEMISGMYDHSIFHFISYLDPKPQIVWDVGAHFGYSSLVFSKIVGKGGKVMSFEPNRFNIDHFRLHISKNPEVKNITLHQEALSDETGRVEFLQSDMVMGSQSTGSHLIGVVPPQEEEVYERFNFEIETVAANTIDFILSQDQVEIPDVIKIDVEGAEAMVLKGGTKTLKKHHPKLLIEVHNVIAMMKTMKSLTEMGYKDIGLIPGADFSASRCFIYARNEEG